MKHSYVTSLLAVVLFVTCIQACDTEAVKKIRKKISYKNILSKFKKKEKVETVESSDTSNLLDNFDPAKDSIRDYLTSIETVYQADSSLIKKIGKDEQDILNKPTDTTNEETVIKKDTFSSDIKKIAPQEIAALKYNLEQLKQTVENTTIDSTATHIKSAVWADVSKKDQRLYLYVEGECVDTFKISSGDKNHTTPNIDRRPCGPSFQKYTSKKYPGGNYNGLGNMPYVVFVQGGYGLHGTTNGNIPKLGTRASHGCVRLHPNNAKIFFELVKTVGIENTWVTIRD